MPTHCRQELKFRAFSRNPTVFIVSQRTSSIRHADKIIVLDGGKMVGLGTHEELLKSCDLYCEIHYSQFEKEGAFTTLKVMWLLITLVSHCARQVIPTVTPMATTFSNTFAS